LRININSRNFVAIMDESDHKIHNKNSDQKIWDDYTKDIKQLKNKKSKTKNNNPKQEIAEQPAKTVNTKITVPSDHNSSTQNVNHVKSDKRTAEKLRRGKFNIEARLDLHGLNRETAFDALRAFILNSYNTNKKCVLVITGKGGWQDATESLMDKKPGILRQSLPQWLSDPALKSYVLDWQTAKPKDGGKGAFYVLLRRKK